MCEAAAGSGRTEDTAIGGPLSYTVIATAPGHRPVRRAVTIRAGSGTTRRAETQITGAISSPAPDAPLPGAQVVAVGSDGAVAACATTGRDGGFRLAVPAPGRPGPVTTQPSPDAAAPDRQTATGAPLHLTLDGDPA